MRVVYFTESLYPLVDGVSRTLAKLFATLEQRGIDFRVLSPFMPGEEVSWRDRVTAVAYVRFPLYPDYRVSLPLGGRVRAELSAAKPDLVHLVSPTPMAYRAQRIARRRGVPVVASFHTHFVSYFRHYGVARLEPVGWRLLRGFYSRCDRVYAPSHSMAGELRALGIERVELWSRGIDAQSFSPAHRDPSLIGRAGGDTKLPTLLLVSRLVKEKDLADLITVDGILRARGVGFNFVIVGDGPMRATLEAALPHALFVGHRTGIELARWYASSDVFVFPSTTETFGNVVLEAMACGLPAIVVNRGGPQDLVEHGGTGYVVTANDPADIAGHALRLLANDGLRKRMGEAARAAATSRDWAAVNGGLLESYQRLIEERRPGPAAVGRGRNA